jgi:hypothetical protein
MNWGGEPHLQADRPGHEAGNRRDVGLPAQSGWATITATSHSARDPIAIAIVRVFPHPEGFFRNGIHESQPVEGRGCELPYRTSWGSGLSGDSGITGKRRNLSPNILATGSGHDIAPARRIIL